jgi:hypothetical protein
MKAKDKAKELIDRFYFNGIKDEEYSMQYEDGVQCALICVDEMIREIKQIQFNHDVFLEDTEISYWWKVRQEIEKL